MGYASRLADSVHRYSPEAQPALDRFRRRMFGEHARQVEPALFSWLFEQNPRRRRSGPDLWYIKKGEEVLGQQAGIPVRLMVDGRPVDASWAIDLMVQPKWRLRGVGPVLSGVHQQHWRVALALGLSEPAYRSCLRAGWTDLGSIDAAFRPLEITRLPQPELSPPARLVVRLVPDVAVRGSAHAIAASVGHATHTHVEVIERFDERIDALWSKAEGSRSILVTRDLIGLRWRFDALPDPDLYTRLLLMHGDEVVGYVVVRMDDWDGLPVGSIVDYFSAPQWTLPLFAHAVDELSRQGAAGVSWVGLDRVARLPLKRLGFISRPCSTRFMCKLRSRSDLSIVRLGHRASWFLTAADSDLDHRVLTPAE